MGNQKYKTMMVLNICSFLFWILAKISFSYEFIVFNIFYSIFWPFMTAFTIFLTLYFLLFWTKNKFKLSSKPFLGFLLGVITLVIMRFVMVII